MLVFMNLVVSSMRDEDTAQASSSELIISLQTLAVLTKQCSDTIEIVV